jgi:hypothetical protein
MAEQGEIKCNINIVDEIVKIFFQKISLKHLPETPSLHSFSEEDELTGFHVNVRSRLFLT